MGRYCTASDCYLRYNDIYSVNSDVDAVDSGFIFFAEHELDARLSKQFTVPFSSDNITAKDLAIDMTYLRAGNIGKDEEDELSDRIDKRIKDLLNGDMDMIVSSGTLVTVGDTVWSNDMDYHLTFGHGDVEDFHVDSSQTYAEEIERDS